MKIIWFSHRDIMHPRAGGVERAIYEISRRLVRNGHEVTWITVISGSLKLTEIKSGILIERNRNNILAHLLVPKILHNRKHDIVIDDLGHVIPWGSEKFTRSKGVVSFWHLHRRSLSGQVSLPLRLILTALEKSYPILYPKWSFITESNASFNDLCDLGIRRDRIYKVPLGLSSSNFLKLNKSITPTIVYFGGMRDYKRPWDSIYALKEIIKYFPECKLFMIGDGPSLTKLKRLTDKLRLTSNISFTGRLSYSEVQKVVGRSWVNVHTSLMEGFGLSIIEASALGTPTVAYEVRGVSEAIKHMQNGILVQNGNLEDLVDGILKIMRSFPNHWMISSIKAAKSYSWDETSKLWEKCLIKILQES